jgi:hypothetical protein
MMIEDCRGFFLEDLRGLERILEDFRGLQRT